MRHHRLRNQRGSILLFVTVLVVPLMIIIAGLAMDLGYYGTVDDELQRAMDASALAGAGNLGFDASAFTGDDSPVRQAAQLYATSNPYRAENLAKQITSSTFTPNASNADSGNIVVGIWNGTTSTVGSYPPGFTPWASSTDDAFVNAVKCQYASSIPTSFLKLIGLSSLPTAARAIAVSNPPTTLCPGCCLFPIGVTQCPFQTGGNMGSQGCGQPVATFTPATTNTAAWINVNGLGTPNKPDLQAAVDAAAAGTCTTSVQSGSEVGTNNGEIQSVYDSLAQCNGNNCKDGPGTTGYFIDKYNSGPIYTTRDSNENITYQGHGWEVYVAVIKTDTCPAGAITNEHQILTFSRLVITQVIDHGRCAVQNHWTGNIWDAQCPTPNGTCATCSGGSLNAIFGYFSCAPMDALPAPIPAPRAALATKLKLVR